MNSTLHLTCEFVILSTFVHFSLATFHCLPAELHLQLELGGNWENYRWLTPKNMYLQAAPMIHWRVCCEGCLLQLMLLCWTVFRFKTQRLSLSVTSLFLYQSVCIGSPTWSLRIRGPPWVMPARSAWLRTRKTGTLEPACPSPAPSVSWPNSLALKMVTTTTQHLI